MGRETSNFRPRRYDDRPKMIPYVYKEEGIMSTHISVPGNLIQVEYTSDLRGGVPRQVGFT